jgi:hypothetical protein
MEVLDAHAAALLRNLQSFGRLGVDKNTTVVFAAPLMTTIAELGAFAGTSARGIVILSRLRPFSRPST